jgi:hypothetical protein
VIRPIFVIIDGHDKVTSAVVGMDGAKGFGLALCHEPHEPLWAVVNPRRNASGGDFTSGRF